MARIESIPKMGDAPLTLHNVENKRVAQLLRENPYMGGVALFASLGGLLFGYDQGVVSGILSMQSFGAAFPKVYADDSFRGWFVSTLLLAAWFRSLFNGPVADRLGRKLSMIVAVVILLPSEIFTLSSRPKTISITISATWMCNFVIGLGTPTMHSTLGWGTYIFFAAFCALAFLFAWFCVPETKAKSLEDMDAVFGNSAAHEQKLQLYQVAAELQETETSVVMDDKV